MTSGNVSDEPIAYRDEDAIARLGSIADAFLLHDRKIETRTDDSVLRSARVAGRRRPVMLRRSRGYVPAPLTLPVAAQRPLLACGAEQKSTFCVASGSRAWVGHHIGDLEHFSTLQAFRDGIAHFEALFAVAPEPRRPRPAPRLPVHALRAGARGGDAGRRAASPRAPWRRAWPSTG